MAEPDEPVPFTRQTTPVADPDRPGRWTATVTGDWNAPVLPHGGVMTSIALRALEADLALPAQRLRSVSTVFAAQVPVGPVEVETNVLRRGRSLSQGQAVLRAVGSEAGFHVTAVFGADRVGYSFADARPPEVPPPGACHDFLWGAEEAGFDFAFEPTFWQQCESRPAIGHRPWEEWPAGSSLKATWYRFRDTPRLADGTIDPMALVTFCDTMPGAIGEYTGSARRALWLAPSADLTVHVLDTARSEWLLAVNRARHASDGYASVDMELWDPDGWRIVAYGTQVCFMSFPEGFNG